MTRKQSFRFALRDQGKRNACVACPESAMHTDINPRADRRRLLQAITTAGVGGATVLPAHWSRPAVDVVLLPAHAQVTPMDVPPTCLLTCTRARTDIVFIVPQGVGGIVRTEAQQCVSQNDESSSTSSDTVTSGFTAFSEFTLSTGTYSTLFTLSALTGTSSDVTVFFTSVAATLEQACQA